MKELKADQKELSHTNIQLKRVGQKWLFPAADDSKSRRQMSESLIGIRSGKLSIAEF